ncbi:glutaminase [Pseudoalteromonas ulvae UL12]|uniref:Glutaminase n=1 Tax=Pseudoalteromonas ulvae TaxID=107327 RepID=A0A2C9ZZP0_PSEDV|nr:glutaminase B [Pseudoalteromonas ulvae]MBE0364621.1 glutaminase [Pseudoalteromonas ulvae UL12]OUL56232.1 glutaminase [Pseudoalteromonas ulvae]
MQDIQHILDSINVQARQFFGQGKVANYIPALAEVAADQFSIAVHTVDGQTYSSGDDQARFSIQSVSKVLTLTLALRHHGDDLWQRVGKEPSGTAFNSLAQLEFEKGIPRNPFINAGALVVCDALVGRVSAPVYQMLETARLLAGNEKILINKKVADSEYLHRHRNAAMAHLMKSFNNFNCDVDQVLKAYFSYCAIEMTGMELAKTFSYLAHQGVCVQSGRRMLSAKQTQQMNSLLFTSGLYDAAGDFAFRVGIPGKSGVGGGIIGIVPGQFTVCVWSPALNEYGNSVAGLQALEMLAEKMNISML